MPEEEKKECGLRGGQNEWKDDTGRGRKRGRCRLGGGKRNGKVIIGEINEEKV